MTIGDFLNETQKEQQFELEYSWIFNVQPWQLECKKDLGTES